MAALSAVSLKLLPYPAKWKPLKQCFQSWLFLGVWTSTAKILINSRAGNGILGFGVYKPTTSGQGQETLPQRERPCAKAGLHQPGSLSALIYQFCGLHNSWKRKCRLSLNVKVLGWGRSDSVGSRGTSILGLGFRSALVLGGTEARRTITTEDRNTK